MRQVLVLLMSLLILSCSSAYYAGMERLGYHKRDLLESRVSSVKQSQGEAKEQFRSALDAFRSVVAFNGGALSEKYELLSSQLDRSEDKADEVRARIRSVKKVSEDLFKEWQDELRQYKNQDLRRKSEDRLIETQQDFRLLLTSMKKAESKMEPVLVVFRDHVLFLKHNLNARALSSLSSEVPVIEGRVDELVRDMEYAISDAESFLATLKS